VGLILVTLAVPLPYYARLCVYYAVEHDEVADRRAAVDRLHLRFGFDRDLLHVKNNNVLSLFILIL